MAWIISNQATFAARARIAEAFMNIGTIDSTDRTFVIARQPRHRKVIAFGSVALVGVAILMLLRPNLDSASSRETNSRGSVVIPDKADADPKNTLPATALALTATKTPRLATPSQTTPVAKRKQQTARPKSSSPIAKGWSQDERWLAH
jgi:hypothetical protein